VRIIAATNRDLKAAVAAGTFRSDLLCRTNVFSIAVPPLGDRRDDIPLLVEYLTERYASKAGKKIKNIHKRTLELFQSYDWPGNIRELQNVIERAVILCDGQTFSVDESRLQPESPRTAAAGNGLARLGAQRRTRTKRTGLGRQSRSDCGSERRGCEDGDYRSPRSKRKSESWEPRSTSSIPPEILSIIYLTFFEARTVCRNPPIVGTRHAR